MLRSRSVTTVAMSRLRLDIHPGPETSDSPVEVVAGERAKRWHLQVRVRVDAARHDQLARGVNDPGTLWRLCSSSSSAADH